MRIFILNFELVELELRMEVFAYKLGSKMFCFHTCIVLKKNV